MKTFLLPIVLLLLATTAFSQVKTNPASPAISTPSKEQLLTESKNQKKIGRILLLGGIGLVIAGAATYEPNINAFGAAPLDDNDNTLPAVLAVAGLFSIVGGVVQLATAKESKKKALSMVIHQERVPISQQGAITVKAVPTAGLQLAF